MREAAQRGMRSMGRVRGIARGHAGAALAARKQAGGAGG